MAISDTLNGYPLLLLPPDLDAGATQRSTSHDLDEFEGDVGTSHAATHTLPNTQEQVAYLFRTRDELDELEAFLRTLQGSAGSFWLPTWNDDMIVLSSSSGSMLIEAIDYTVNQFPTHALRYIYAVSQTDSTVWAVRSVTNAVDNLDGTESLTGSYNVGGFSTATSAAYRFMFLRFVRLANDEVTIEHLDGEQSLVTLTVLNVPGSYPPFNVAFGTTPVYLSGADNGDGTYVASLPGKPPGDTRIGYFLSIDPIPCSGSWPAICPVVYSTVPELTWTSYPLRAGEIRGIISVSFGALNLGTGDRFPIEGVKAIIRVMRGGVEITNWQTNYGGGSFFGGDTYMYTPPVVFDFVDGDYLIIEFWGHIALRAGYADDGNRLKIGFGSGGFINVNSYVQLPGEIYVL